MTWGHIVVGVASSVLVLVGTVISARFSRRTGEEANQTDAAKAATADWDAFTKRVDADNIALRTRVDALEDVVAELRLELRSRDRRIDDLSDELDDFRQYATDLRSELQRQDPSLRLPAPPARIARHFQP
ncbi:MAG TPA: hypothetical protein GX743_01630 [Actinomycetales bacterium]|nr:hypothetical protein [Actinomycetales bacterium]